VCAVCIWVCDPIYFQPFCRRIFQCKLLRRSSKMHHRHTTLFYVTNGTCACVSTLAEPSLDVYALISVLSAKGMCAWSLKGVILEPSPEICVHFCLQHSQAEGMCAWSLKGVILEPSPKICVHFCLQHSQAEECALGA
jgi:hypothetical protein